MKDNLTFIVIIDDNVDAVLLMEALSKYQYTVKRIDSRLFFIATSDLNDKAQSIFNKLKEYIKLPNESTLLVSPLDKFYGRLPVETWEWLKISDNRIKTEEE